MKKKSIILIGGEGYIGTVVSSFFLKKGFKVHSIYNFIYNQSRKNHRSNKNFNLLKINFANKKIFNYLDKLEHENIIILGSIVGDPITKKYPKKTNPQLIRVSNSQLNQVVIPGVARNLPKNSKNPNPIKTLN